MTMPKAFFSRAALLGVGLVIALSAWSQEPASTPATEPAASPAASLYVALPCVSSPTRGAFSRPQMPLPPELEQDLVIVKAGSTRVLGKPFSLKPYAIRELKLGPMKRFSSGGALPLGPAALLTPFWVEALDIPPARNSIAFEKLEARQDFSFQLGREGAGEAPPVEVRCAWVSALTRGGWMGRTLGVEMKVPEENLMACEFSEAPGVEPWRLMLWVGRPSDLLSPDFPSGGVLHRGDIRYEASSTNVMKPSLAGMKATALTGTLFTKGGRGVAAVERIPPGRILIPCSVSAADQSLFVAAGAALLLRDSEASRFER